jgi:hypothetical protein
MVASREKCPWCGNEVTHEKFNEIASRIRKEEEQRLKDRESEIRHALQGQFKRQIQSERDAAALAERKRIATEQGVLQQQLKAEKLKMQGAVAASAERERKLTERLAEQAKADQQRALNELRNVLANSHQRDIEKLRSEHIRDTDRIQKKVDALERELKKESAHDRGEGGEIDLYEALREHFPDDRISRVPKGESGADLLFNVMHKGEECGLIILDSKNRQSWQRNFALKLRDDQIVAKADHAVLATTVFPAGQKELWLEEGVIVVNPVRAVYIVAMLRAMIVKMHVSGLTLKEKDGKMEELYSWITSDEFERRISDTVRITKELEEVDVQEQEAHKATWKKRGRLQVKLKTLLNEIDSEVAGIVQAPSSAMQAIEELF